MRLPDRRGGDSWWCPKNKCQQCHQLLKPIFLKYFTTPVDLSGQIMKLCNPLNPFTGVSITHFASRTLLLKYSNFQQIYKKNSANFIKNSILTRLVPNKRKQCSIRMLVGLHTHYQMHLASTFTLFFLWNLTQLRLFTFKYSWILWKRTLFL